jgi:hypothetical protein
MHEQGDVDNIHIAIPLRPSVTVVRMLGRFLGERARRHILCEK